MAGKPCDLNVYVRYFSYAKYIDSDKQQVDI